MGEDELAARRDLSRRPFEEYLVGQRLEAASAVASADGIVLMELRFEGGTLAIRGTRDFDSQGGPAGTLDADWAAKEWQAPE